MKLPDEVLIAPGVFFLFAVVACDVILRITLVDRLPWRLSRLALDWNDRGFRRYTGIAFGVLLCVGLQAWVLLRVIALGVGGVAPAALLLEVVGAILWLAFVIWPYRRT